MSGRPQCRFFKSPGGCRFGGACRFSHTDPRQSPPSPTPSTASNPRSPQSSSQASNSSPPGGACRFYWNTGNCKREFECKYKHIRSNATAEHPQPRAPLNSLPESTKASIAPFLTEQGLAKINGVATDGFFSEDVSTSMSPTDAHGRIKRFLQEGYRFRTVFDIYAFVTTLNSATSSNKLWTQEEGQLLFTNVASTEGSLRITEIINWPEVSTRAGSSGTTLSFQRGILPLLRYLSSEYVVKSTLVTHANHLYTLVLQNMEKLVETIEKCVNDCMSRHSFVDPRSAKVPSTPIDTQVFASIAGLIHEILIRFKNVVASHPKLGTLGASLRTWVEDWVRGVKQSPPLFSNPLGPTQSIPVRDLIIGSIEDRVARITSIIERETRKEARTKSEGAKDDVTARRNRQEALVSALNIAFQGPGDLRSEGPRHDNDHEDIYDIRVAPTHQELLSREQPYLPANFYNAPHHAPADSMQRLLDIQFRLLREELTAPLRKAVQLIHDDLCSANFRKTKLASLLDKKGGKYHGISDAHDSLMFNLYTGVRFLSILPGWKGLSTSLTIDTPPGRARSDRPGARTAFWESMGGKRLMQGGLIAMVWQTRGRITINLGTISSSFRDPEIKGVVSRSNQVVRLQILFFDPEVELRVLHAIRSKSAAPGDTLLLVESPVMLEAVRPFLEALKTEPEILPFSQYLVHHPDGHLQKSVIQPPRYSTLPNFTFQLSCLFPDEMEVGDLRLSVSDPVSIANARAELRHSRLDPSQADAVVDALTREVALIQGPPGTGKSFTGVEILRVLRENNIGPILMIAFTNHALDHMLSSVLDAGITYRIVRLGRQSNDERIRNYSIETLEMANRESRIGRAFSHYHRDLKDIQKQIEDLMKKLLGVDVDNDSGLIMEHINIFYPEHHEHLTNHPPTISKIREILLSSDGGGEAGAWQKVGRGGKIEEIDESIYGFWKEARDEMFLQQVLNGSLAPWRATSPPPPRSLNKFGLLTVDSQPQDEGDLASTDSEDSDELDEHEAEENWTRFPTASHVEVDTIDQLSDEDSLYLSSLSTDDGEFPKEKSQYMSDIHDIRGFLAYLGYPGLPTASSSDRSIAQLLGDGGSVWLMSQPERIRLHNFWVEQARQELAENQTTEFQRLRTKHSEKLTQCNEGKQEARRNLLQTIDIIGCTTTGAAQLTTLLKALSPRVLLVEEAGQVMEAHILGSLVPSIEHLILIGDPLQLRPTLNNFGLSMDSKRGRELYRFDMSLMERLSTSGLAMSRIDVQRRMRPAISSLIRNTLYPKLEDHPLVSGYPNVRGIGKNVFFLNHTHPENDGADETTSKFNTYEVLMIRDLVLYLLRQGCYSEEGDIVVLCAYLGQLARLRDALAGEIAVVIDERDQAALDDTEDASENESGSLTVERVNVTKRVRLRTVDNYQGEEGRVVILSLVRNSGDPEDDDVEDRVYRHGIRPTIGFLRSRNRTNVALSRAKEGLFIFGNAQNLSAHSDMWKSIVDELDQGDSLGAALPVVCHRHPDTIEMISKPGQLPSIAPDGGCLRPCSTRLPCGHLCPYKCHCDDAGHLSVVCMNPCRKLCPRNHPCLKVCSEECGRCVFPVTNVLLPCGHIRSSVPCWQIEDLDTVFCDCLVNKALSSCEHSAELACGRSPADYACHGRCGVIMNCCGKACAANCDECQKLNSVGDTGRIIRSNHKYHRCEKDLQCGHRCQESCSVSHEHTVKCMESCRQLCPHAKCRLPCHVPCAPCQEICSWNCDHQTCPVSCGSACVRLPCDMKCSNILECGHSCPSVCGEDCSIQICLECGSLDQKTSVVDLILYRTLEDLIPDSIELDEMIITNPSCGHAFTVETLDGIVGLRDFYAYDEKRKRWTGLKSPNGLVKRPTCPTCRTVITSPRYGRVTKRADLDILERNVAAQMSRSLDSHQRKVISFKEEGATSLIAREMASLTIPTPKPFPKLGKLSTARQSILNGTSDLPISERAINPANKDLFYINGKALDLWKKTTHPLFTAYQDVIKTAGTRPAHTQAWESAFSFLYEREINEAVMNPTSLPRHMAPQDHAMRMARIQIGSPRPLADKRFLVEAFWSSINIRLILVRLGEAWLDEANKHPAQYPEFHRNQWAIYVKFLLDSCVRDAEKAHEIAKNSEAHRQIVRCTLLCMRTVIERFRFNFSMCKRVGAIQKNREQLLSKASSLLSQARDDTGTMVSEYLDRPGIDRHAEGIWIVDNFTNTAQVIVDEWEEIARSIRMDTFYQPVSLEEKMSIVRAMGFATTGHFYACPNGHVFTIGDCGGAMQTSRCPECNAVIGGQNHQLDSSNTRSDEFDNLARRTNPAVRAGYWNNPYGV